MKESKPTEELKTVFQEVYTQETDKMKKYCQNKSPTSTMALEMTATASRSSLNQTTAGIDRLEDNKDLQDSQRLHVEKKLCPKDLYVLYMSNGALNIDESKIQTTPREKSVPAVGQVQPLACEDIVQGILEESDEVLRNLSTILEADRTLE